MCNSLPHGWRLSSFSNVFSEIRNGCSLNQNTQGKGVPVSRIETISHDSINYQKVGWLQTEVNIEKYRLQRGDILFSHINSVTHIGKCALKNDDELLYHGMNLLMLRIKEGDFTPGFVHQLLSWDVVRSDFRKKAKQAINQASLNLQDIKGTAYPTPPLPEQKKIATILSSVDEVIEKTRAQIEKLKDLKTGMMQELLTKGIGHTEFKDSPVGRIPASWRCSTLESVLQDIIDCEHKTAPYVDRSEYLVVRTANVRDGQLSTEEIRHTTKEAYLEWTARAIPSFGDILFTREAPAGESCIVPNGLNVCLGQRMVLIRPTPGEVLPQFLSLFLNTGVAKAAIYKLSIGTTVTRINIEDIRKIPCVVPPMLEQERIVKFFSELAIRLSKTEQKLHAFTLTKRALMQDLLTGKVRVNVNQEEAASA